MTISLLGTNYTWPVFRVIAKRSFDAAVSSVQDTSGGGWQVLPMQKRGSRRHGLEVVSFSRGALPFVGRAVLKLEYGQFADGFIGADSGAAQQLTAGSAWNPAGDALNLQDLRGWEIRIQAGDAVSTDATPAWRTVWWGQCEYQEDTGAPGAVLPMGTRTYHCVDGLQRANRWMMSIHGYTNNYDGTVQYPGVVGAMGYNTPTDSDTRVSMNRWRSPPWTNAAGLDVTFHTAPGLGDAYWTMQQAAEHAMALVKPPSEPQFKFRGWNGDPQSLALLGGVFAWPVRETDTALDVLVRICKRERGRGVVFVDWADDGDDPSGPIQVFLTVAPQLLDDISYTSDATSQTKATLPGANTCLNIVDVDLIGDHRQVDTQYRLGDPYQFRYDYVETVGEQIELAATLSYQDGQKTPSTKYYTSCALVPRWTSGELTSFLAASAADRRQSRYRSVYQAHGLRPNWQGLAGNGDDSDTRRCDYRCDDTGAIVLPATSPLTSPGLIKILPDIPLFQGFDYTTKTIARFDGTTDAFVPTRRRMFGGFRIGSNRFLLWDESDAKPSVHLDNQGEIWIVGPADEDTGFRAYSDKTLTAVAPAYDYQQIWLTVGLRLPHRVRFASGDPNGKKRARLEFKDYHLWLAHPGCIWDVDTTVGSTSAGWGAKRAPANAGGGNPGILRDDRNALAVIHAQLWAWYGTDTDRRSASWAVRGCGFLPSFDVAGENITTPSGTPVIYPRLGQVVTTLAANGQDNTVNTPITMMEYDNRTGVTTWTTEWSELEFE